jgi:hypothetical protein
MSGADCGHRLPKERGTDRIRAVGPQLSPSSQTSSIKAVVQDLSRGAKLAQLRDWLAESLGEPGMQQMGPHGSEDLG